MRKNKSTSPGINSTIKALRERRVKALKERNQIRKSKKGKLPKEELQLWESEKELLKSQKRMEALENKFRQAEREYQDSLWRFIQTSVKANRAKRIRKTNGK